MVKNPPAKQEMEDTKRGFDPGLGRSAGGGNGSPLQHSCPGESHGQRGLTGYSPWGRKESDTTEKQSTQTKVGFPRWLSG